MQEGGLDLQKIESLMGGRTFLIEMGDKPEKGGVDVEMGGGATFFITLQFNHIYFVCVGKVRFLLLLFKSLVF